MFKLIKKIKNKLTRKSKKQTAPKPLPYSSIWSRIIVMDTVQRNAAFQQGFSLATRGRPGAELLTGHRLMEVITMVNLCIDVMNGDEDKGLSLAKETFDDHYMDDAEEQFRIKYMKIVEEE